MSHDDFAFEPVRGLPELLPAGEQLLWQGAPNWWTLARRQFHVDKLAVYFLLMIGWQCWDVISMPASGSGLLLSTAIGGLSLALVPIVLLSGIAWLYGRTTVYSITSARVVIRSGIAVPITVNLPFRLIQSVAFKQFRDGSGEFPMQLVAGERTGYVIMWPNVRPLHFLNPQPMLRCVPEAQSVAALLGEAMRETVVADDQTVPALVGSGRALSDSVAASTEATEDLNTGLELITNAKVSGVRNSIA